jgi:uncharacterized membrane-anchored protein
MKLRFAIVSLLLVLPPSAAFAADVEQPSPADSVKWVEGPADGKLGSQATIKVPEGYIFADGDDTRKLMESMHNTVSGTEQGFLAKKGESWFIVFEYDDSGYVSDAEKDKLDADAILKSLQNSNEEGNKERKRRGWGTLTIDGWETKPAYNTETHNIEWATRLRSEDGGVSINHNFRILGRGGVMSAVLVAGPDEIAAAAPVARQALAAGYAYNPGKTYAEFRQGDKIAKYGLIGLITGGAAVVAVKSGLLKYLWKFILVGVAAIAGVFKKLFGSKKSTGTST